MLRPRQPAAHPPDRGRRDRRRPHASSRRATGTGSRPSAPAPASAGRAAVVILPDVRGLHPYYEELALRFAERGHGRDRHRLVRPDRGRRRTRRRLRLRAARDADDLGRHLGRHRGGRHGRARRSRLRRPAATGGVHAGVLHGWADVVPGRNARPRPRWRHRPVRHARRAVAQRRPGAARPRGLIRLAGARTVRRGGPGHHARPGGRVRRGARRRRRGASDRDVPERPAQLLRPQGRRVRRRERGGVGRDRGLHRPGAEGD